MPLTCTSSSWPQGKPPTYPREWTPRELRHTFVSLMSNSGVPVEGLARLAGHTNSGTTELVYGISSDQLWTGAPRLSMSCSVVLLNHPISQRVNRRHRGTPAAGWGDVD